MLGVVPCQKSIQFTVDKKMTIIEYNHNLHQPKMVIDSYLLFSYFWIFNGLSLKKSPKNKITRIKENLKKLKNIIKVSKLKHFIFIL